VNATAAVAGAVQQNTLVVRVHYVREIMDCKVTAEALFS